MVGKKNGTRRVERGTLGQISQYPYNSITTALTKIMTGTSRDNLDTPVRQRGAAEMLLQSLIKGILKKSRNKGLWELINKALIGLL